MPCEAMFDISNLASHFSTQVNRLNNFSHLYSSPQGLSNSATCRRSWFSALFLEKEHDQAFCNLAQSTCYEDPVSKDEELELIHGKTPESPEEEVTFQGIKERKVYFV